MRRQTICAARRSGELGRPLGSRLSPRINHPGLRDAPGEHRTGAQAEALAVGQPTRARHVMMAHPLALQLRNLQTLVEITVDEHSTVVFPAPVMSTIQQLGAFLDHETQAAGALPIPHVLPPPPHGPPTRT